MKTIRTIMAAIATMLIFSSNAMAVKERQGTSNISGTVIEAATGQPAAFATVAVLQLDSTVVTGLAADENGAWAMTVQPGKYLLSVSLIGYKDVVMDLNAREGSVKLDPIALEEDAQMLEGAKLTERQALVEMKIDKIVMNVSQSAFAQGTTALELLKKAPGVTIDKDGNVKLNGKSVSVWIDGRPSHLDGKSLEAMLRSTEGGNIDKFELMDNPSAKYDAAGQGGIINIKTKKNFKAGFSGDLGFNGGGMYFGDIENAVMKGSAWTNLSYRTDKGHTFMNLYGGLEETGITIDNELTFDTEAGRLMQDAESLYKNRYQNYNIKFGHDWFINPKNTIGFIATLPGSRSYMGGFDKDKASSFTTQKLDGVLIDNVDSRVDDSDHDTQFSGNVNYTHIFDETRSSEITANIDYYRTSGSTINRIYDVKTYPELMPETHRFVDTDNTVDIYSAKLDYQSVLWGKAMFEAGGKWALSMTDNNMLLTQSGVADINTFFNYREHIGALYSTLSMQLSPKLSGKVGLRGEYTNTFGDWKSSGEQIHRDFLNVFPTFYLGYVPSQKLMLSASYTRRIDRPRYEQLNPSKTYVDAYTYTVGNPDLLPQLSDNFSLSAMIAQRFSVALGAMQSKDLINQNPSYTEDGTKILTWSNFGTMRMGYMAFSIAALPITKWLEWTLNLSGIGTSSSNKEGSYDSKGVFGNAYTCFTMTLPKDWKVELDAFGNTPMTFGYFKIGSNWTSSVAVKKNLLDNRMTLSFDLQDIFRSSRTNINIDPEAIGGSISYIGQKYYNQKAVVGLSWNFGQAKQGRQRKVGNLEEASRIGGSSNGSGTGISTGK